MKPNPPAPRRFRARALLLAACCLALAFGLSAASAQDDPDAAAQGNANNSDAAGAAQTAGQTTNQNAGGAANQAQNANQTQNANQAANRTPAPAATPAPTPFNEKPCGGHKRDSPAYAAKPNAQLSDLEVIDVYRADTDSADEAESAGLYNTICVRVKNLHEWAKAAGGQNDPSKFFLYINTYPLRGVRARPEGGESDYLRFDLLPTEDSDAHDKETRENWRRVLSRPRLAPPKTRDVAVSVGYEADSSRLAPPIKSNAVLPLVVVNAFWFTVFVLSVLVALGLFMWLVFRSDLLRDDVPEPVGVTAKGKPNRKPFSLGRTQMAFWFFLVVTCYVFIWMVTSNGDTITSTVLGLIGISAATALGSVFISASKDDGADQRRQELLTEKERLWTRIAALRAKAGMESPPDAPPPPSPPPAPGPLTAGEQTELKGITRRLRDVEQLLAGASRGFFTDILSDAGGVSFHRFQIVAWTVALGAVFLGQVFNYLLMPDFDSTLLALMGISSGTYLGFKFPEKQA
ncbi:MAG TPA: hypothetical protein VF668_16255 [Pyrinomonadaceae bacterium]|jgi:hypothetical protein